MNKTNAIANTLLVTISIVIALLLSELVARVMKLSPEVVYIEKWRVRFSKNPKIGYEPIPNFDSAGKSVQYHSYDGQSNDLGFRDYDHNLQKPEGMRRIIILGDSITAGLWVNDDTKVFPAVIEKQLQSLDLNIDVMNFGVSGYNTQQEVETLKDKGLQYKPDLVILAYCLNDTRRDDGGIYAALLQEQTDSALKGKIPSEVTLNPIVKHSDFLRFIKFAVLKQGTAKNKDTHQDGDKGNKFDNNTVAKYFTELGHLSALHSFEVLVLIFPDFGEKDAHLERLETYPFEADHLKVKQLASDANLPYLDLFELFQECHNEANHPISYDRYHPNPEGHVCIGKKIAEYLAKNWN